MLDLGDVASVTFYTKDVSGNLAAPAALPTATITLPDGTSTSAGVTVTLVTVGTYRVDYTSAQIGLHGVRAVWTAAAAVAGSYVDAFEVNDPAYLPFVGLSDAKDHLKVTSTATDEKIRGMVLTATAMAENYINQPLNRRSVVQTVTGGQTAILLYTGAISVTSVVENGNTLAAGDYTADLDAGILYRGSTIAPTYWSTGLRNVVVTYVVGYPNPPADLVFGVKEVLRWLWSNSQESNRPSRSSTETGLLSDAVPAWLMRPLDAFSIPSMA